MISDETTKEVAKAVQSVSGPIQEIVSCVRGIVGAPLEEVAGMAVDALRRQRILNWIEFQAKLEAETKSVTLRNLHDALPTRVAYELLEAVTLEDDSEMQSLWAKLMANALDTSTQTSVEKWHVSLLKELTPLEAKVLQAVVHVPAELVKKKGGVPCSGLPTSYTDYGDDKDNLPPPPPKKVNEALWRLISLGCLTDVQSFREDDSVYWVMATTVGKSLVEACERPATPRT